jgi:predicted AlkP superfamily pyrophosphatase or phosphodiesterase
MVINVVGLTPALVGPRTPNLQRLAAAGFSRPLQTIFPAVTCSVQASMLTGQRPVQHGIVGNGWYDRNLAEVQFWKQSNRLIQSEPVYTTARQRDARHTTAKLFWWFNMYSTATWSVTPRPSYPADGRKLPDLYSEPASLRDELQAELGRFPLFNFWGPTADIRSSTWIAESAARVWRKHQPALMLVYLPHLDYDLQRYGGEGSHVDVALQAVDRECGRLIDTARESGAEVVVVSEYGINTVRRPVHLNRVLRESGLLIVRREPLGWETLDAGACRAFAVADHQAAHVYVRESSDLPRVKDLLQKTPGVERVLDRDAQKAIGIDHARSGDLVCVSERDSWFTYYFWLDNALAPDYARTVDIHRKPGYDPAELLINPSLRWPRLRVARRLAQKLLGFRYLMDVIGLDASIVRGSHGRVPDASRCETDGPVLICSSRRAERDDWGVTDIRNLLLSLQFGG